MEQQTEPTHANAGQILREAREVALRALEREGLEGPGAYVQHDTLILTTDQCRTRKAGIQALANAKQEVQDFLMSAYPERRYFHRKLRGVRQWTIYLGGNPLYPDGTACGIRVELTDHERHQILTGVRLA